MGLKYSRYCGSRFTGLLEPEHWRSWVYLFVYLLLNYNVIPGTLVTICNGSVCGSWWFPSCIATYTNIEVTFELITMIHFESWLLSTLEFYLLLYISHKQWVHFCSGRTLHASVKTQWIYYQGLTVLTLSCRTTDQRKVEEKSACTVPANTSSP